MQAYGNTAEAKLYFCEIMEDGGKSETLEWANNAQQARWQLAAEGRTVRAQQALPYHLDRLRNVGMEIPDTIRV